MDFINLAKTYKTPLYIYDFDMMEQKYLSLKNAFAARKSLICYAVKANSNLSVLKFLASLGTGFDCVSIGEVKRALLAGAKNYQIIFSGVGKSDEEIKEALNADILMLNLESEAEFYRVEQIAKEIGKKARISVRVNPNIDPKTHPYISTGLNENKFGVEIDVAKKIYIKAKSSPFIEPVGIHFHIGSQLTELKPIYDACALVSKLLRELIALEINIKFFDVGGGIGIVYNDETTIKPYDYAQAILSTLSGLDVTIVCEPGRYIVGESGYFVSSVLYEKINKTKRFIIVDGAMNDLVRPSFYGAYHKVIYVPIEIQNEEKTTCDIVGPICESGDFLAKNISLPKTNRGDLIILGSAGAYGFSMSSNYNTRNRAAEVAIYNGKDRLIRKRESFEDQIALEKGCLN